VSRPGLIEEGVSVVLEVAHTLEGWGEYYVILGAAAGALVGLMFVVIALRSEGATTNSVDRFEAFATPTLVAFSTVLVLSALLTVPEHSELSMSVALLISGAAGIVYTVYNTRQVQRENGYTYMSDWFWRHIAPGLDYVALIVAGILVWTDAAAAMYVVGAAASVMLFIGIHNAWDTAVWIAADHSEDAS
jgi:hypothetical protein